MDVSRRSGPGALSSWRRSATPSTICGGTIGSSPGCCPTGRPVPPSTRTRCVPGFVSLGIPESKIRTIRNGIDLQAFPRLPKDPEAVESWRIPPGSTIVAMAARMASPQKDYVTFLRAAQLVVAQAPSAYFLLIGDGPDRGRIESTIRELGIDDRMRLLGVRNDVWTILNNIDIFVLSTHFEGCSNVIMEAMAAGKPVVATTAGGNAELVTRWTNWFDDADRRRTARWRIAFSG